MAQVMSKPFIHNLRGMPVSVGGGVTKKVKLSCLFSEMSAPSKITIDTNV
jgi:hypothetical protein